MENVKKLAESAESPIRGRNIVLLPVISAMIWAACFGVGTASSVRTINLPEMVNAAGMVFYGKCVSVEASSTSGFPTKLYSFQVIEALKGVGSEDVVTFQQIAGSGALRVPGIPEYQKGQTLLLFLYPDSRLGLTSPVGLGQGCFRARGLSDEGVGLMNAYGNRNLSARLDTTAARETGLSAQQINQLRTDDPIPMDTMRDVLFQLLRFSNSDEVVKK